MCLVTSKILVGSKDKDAGLDLSYISILFLIETVFHFLFLAIIFLFPFIEIAFFL